ncbi:methyl-accepting chemotaxis protein [Desulfonatronum thiosulfatophilum]|uniref:Methyl-accepting chemotaxis protein n=1 Tax=Desulfonatronum thiosulfatophilum TaxID=617002 RepID=A0A1G6EY62_9BACT|nr:methyl-accepting chemotaxis protein [Desulfonatronum thiosulfatophilum]SDB61745.1 methyl-accepting chemotaxis protein [Desulfonatronum thiosulfatophilum]
MRNYSILFLLHLVMFVALAVLLSVSGPGQSLATLKWALSLCAVISLGAIAFAGFRDAKAGRQTREILQTVTDDHEKILRDNDLPNIDGLRPHLLAVAGRIDKLVKMIQEEQAKSDDLRARIQVGVKTLDEVLQGAESSRCQTILSAVDVLKEATEGILRESDKLRNAVHHANIGATDQQKYTSEAATAMEEMNASILESAKNAEDASKDSAQAKARAESGSRIVQETLAAITAVSEKSDELSVSIIELGGQAESIGKIIDVISGIADQTNLLALNAAIEAARAGDAGRGFAVVADEVRKLAEKTMNATREVGQEIETIQTRVRRAVDQVKQTRELVAKSVVLSGESGRSLEEIVLLSQHSSDRTGSIAEAVGQQSLVSEEISRTLTEVSTISSTTQSDMSDSVAQIESLAKRVDDLTTLNLVFERIGHGQVQKLITDLARSESILSLRQAVQEQALRKVIREQDDLELLYVTDARGVQIVANIPRPGMESEKDRKVLGKDWSGRPWFFEAMKNPIPYISGVYTSQASGEPCITVSTTFKDHQGQVLGVVAADVRVNKSPVSETRVQSHPRHAGMKRMCD